MKPFQYIRPKNLKEAVKIAASEPDARYLAGGTNLLDLMKRGIEAPQILIDINHLPLKKIEQKNGITRVGALVLNQDLARHALMQKYHPLLVQAVLAGASGQLRNMATVGGNLLQQTRCSYFYDTALPCTRRKSGGGCSALEGINRNHAVFENQESASCIAVHASDMAVALMALRAQVVVLGEKGERKIPLADFYAHTAKHPDLNSTMVKGELITAVEIPDSPFTKYVHYLKVRDRASFSFALVSAAVALNIQENRIKEARVILGGVAYKPWHLPQVEGLLIDQPVSEALFQQAAEISVTGARALEHNAYKLKLIPNIIAEALRIATTIS